MEAGETVKPILVLTRNEDEDAAREFAGRTYDVVPIAKANGQIVGREVLVWHTRHGKLNDVLLDVERVCRDAAKAKFLISDKPFGPQEAIQTIGWSEFLAWARPRVREDWNAAITDELLAEHVPETLEPEEPDPEQVLAYLSEPPPIFTVEHDDVAWPVPTDFWQNSHLPNIRPESMPQGMAEYVFDMSDLRGVDPSQAAISCFVSAAALIRESISLQMVRESSGWQERARLWGAVIGEPSSRKGVGIEIGDGMVRKLANQFREKDEQALIDYQHASRDYESDMADYRRERKKNPNTQRPEAPERPLLNRLWTDDATLESLGKLLSSHKRGKILVLRDELSGWFGSFDAYSTGKTDKDRPVYLSAYEGKERYIDRSTPGSAFYVPTWSLCILGGIQPSVLAKIADRLGSDGMMQRFMLATSRPAKLSPSRSPDQSIYQRWQSICERLLEMEPHPTHPVKLSAAAQEFRDGVSKWIDQAINSGVSPAMQSALGKYEGLFGRLMLTAHCIKSADAGLTVPEDEVTLETAESAWLYIKEFLFPHAINFHETGQIEEESGLKWAAGLILTKGWMEITQTQLNQTWSGYRKLSPAARKAFWDSLINAGWIRPLPGRASTAKDSYGLPTRYAVNPSIHDGRFDKQAENYKAARERYAELMPSKMPKRFSQVS